MPAWKANDRPIEMTGNPPSAGAPVPAGVMCGLRFPGISAAVRAPAQTALTQAPVGARDRRLTFGLTFDISAQPLDMALALFSTVSGRSAVFSTARVRLCAWHPLPIAMPVACESRGGPAWQAGAWRP